MADEKPKENSKDKDKEKPKDKGGSKSVPVEKDIFIEIVGWVIIVLAVATLLRGITSSVNSSGLFKNGWSGLTTKGITLAYTRPLSSLFNPIGTTVLVSKDSINVLNDAGGAKIGTQNFGTKGKVKQGPVNIGGTVYYDVDFEKGTDGWVAEDDIAYINTQTRPAKVTDRPGETVLAKQDGVVVHENPGWNVVGMESKNSRGIIIKGPGSKDGVNYFYVKFDDGTTGWVSQDDLLIESPAEKSPLANFILFFWSVVTYGTYLLLFIAVIIFIQLVRIVRKLTKIRINNREKLFPTLAVTEPKVSSNPKWERVITHIESTNENNWRLAIIEADIMLSELLDTMQLVGDSIGDKLKGVEKSDFTTIDLAWEAHKVRNEITHSGGDFRITQHEALRVIELYREVFKEFQFI